jgi:Holliday junction resolvase RusA-like endonuclease
MTQYSFTLTGKITPTVRMTRRGKWTSQRAQEYLASQEALRYQLKQQMRDNGWKVLPAKTPLAVELSIGTDKMHTADLDNLLKAALDSANKIVYPDDCWIDKVKVWRYPSNEHQATLTVWIR